MGVNANSNFAKTFIPNENETPNDLVLLNEPAQKNFCKLIPYFCFKIKCQAFKITSDDSYEPNNYYEDIKSSTKEL